MAESQKILTPRTLFFAVDFYRTDSHAASDHFMAVGLVGSLGLRCH